MLYAVTTVITFLCEQVHRWHSNSDINPTYCSTHIEIGYSD